MPPARIDEACGLRGNHLMVGGGPKDDVRLDGRDGSHITWSVGDPVDSDGWGSSRITMISRQADLVRLVLSLAELG